MKSAKKIRQTLAALAMASLLLGTALTASAGGPPPPPPPPWKPTNVKEVLFVLDPNMRTHLGCKLTDACANPAIDFVNRHIDYLHASLEGVQANLRIYRDMRFVSTSIAPEKFVEGLKPFLAQGYDYVILVTPLKSGYQNNIVGGAQKWGELAWFSAQGNSQQSFAHEFGHLQGAGHSRDEMNFPSWAVGYKKSASQGTLMRNDAPRADLYSDQERAGWGDAQHSVGRLLREMNGRYTRWQGVIAPPLH